MIFDGYQVTKSGITATYRTEPIPEPEPSIEDRIDALAAAIDLDAAVAAERISEDQAAILRPPGGPMRRGTA